MNIEKNRVQATIPAPYSLDNAIRVIYRNYRGEVAQHTIIPTGKLYWGKNERYIEEQWIMEVWDLEKQDFRDYALRNIQEFLK